MKEAELRPSLSSDLLLNVKVQKQECMIPKLRERTRIQQSACPPPPGGKEIEYWKKEENRISM